MTKHLLPKEDLCSILGAPLSIFIFVIYLKIMKSKDYKRFYIHFIYMYTFMYMNVYTHIHAHTHAFYFLCWLTYYHVLNTILSRLKMQMTMFQEDPHRVKGIINCGSEVCKPHQNIRSALDLCLKNIILLSIATPTPVLNKIRIWQVKLIRSSSLALTEFRNWL